jgi:type II secretory pathway component PulF
MKFLYQARNKEGEVKRGFVVAVSQSKAEQLLTDNGFIIISLQVKNESLLERYNFFARHISYKDLVLFSRQLSTLISARVPILQSLRILETQMTNKGLLNIVRSLITSVEGGESFSLALSKHPDTFGNIYVSLVRSGEAAGAVGQALSYLADQLEKDYELRSRVKGAMTYPLFVLLALAVVGVLMFKFVLPKLTAVLEEQGGELPLVSKMLISFTHFFQVYWWLVLLLMAGGVIFIRFYIGTTIGRYQWDRLKIHLPIIGEIFKKIYLARFARNLSTLVAGGIPIIQALKIISDIINNVIYRDILLDAATQVTNGKSISDALMPHPEFPPIVTQMVKVGEQSAQLDSILQKLAVFYEKEVDAKVGTLSTLLEPIIMIILGIGVGALVAGVLLPIYNLASTVG